ncbi:unnamed protein product, partial [Musa acuminata subsp. malaccensis]
SSGLGDHIDHLLEVSGVEWDPDDPSLRVPELLGGHLQQRREAGVVEEIHMHQESLCRFFLLPVSDEHRHVASRSLLPEPPLSAAQQRIIQRRRLGLLPPPRHCFAEHTVEGKGCRCSGTLH